MEKEKIQELMARYREGRLNEVDKGLIEQAIERGEVELHQLEDLNKISNQVAKMDMPSPSGELTDRFYSMLSLEKGKQKKVSFSITLPSWSFLLPRMAFMLLLLTVGFSAGYWLKQPTPSSSVAELNEEVSQLKEMVMLSLLEKESATERLKAVGLTNQMDQASQKVTAALLKTLNSDENVNVRLAALEALKPYVQDSRVREGLIKSIGLQESPLVQMSLAELMAAMQEKKSVIELKKLLENERVPVEVKKKINESIEVLI